VDGGPEFTPVGEDSLATYYRCRIPVLPGVSALGLFLVPRGEPGPVPLVISMHGGRRIAGTRHLPRRGELQRHGPRAVRNGWAVWAPTHLFRAEGYPDDIRQRTDRRLRLVGTTLTALEVFKITRGLSALLARPEVDPARVAMVGLSYGGHYTQLTMALDGRIKAGVSSCFFGWRTAAYWNVEDGGSADRLLPHGSTLFGDPEVVALICPRPLQVQMGTGDTLVRIEPAREQAPRAAAYYQELGLGERFEYREFDGWHEFDGTLAWDFLRRHL
jgi:dienelactone hydrolase